MQGPCDLTHKTSPAAAQGSGCASVPMLPMCLPCITDAAPVVVREVCAAQVPFLGQRVGHS